MSEKVLWLKGCAGLGNRLYTLSAALEYAKKTQRKLFVDWTDGQFASKGDNAFFKAFELKNIDYIHTIEDIDYCNASIFPPEWYSNPTGGVYDFYKMIVPEKNIFQKIPIKYLPRGNLRKIYGYWRSKSLWDKVQKSKLNLVPIILRNKNVPMGDHYAYGLEEDIVIYIDYCPPLRAVELKLHVNISPRITEIVNQFIDKNSTPGNLVGVHVRNTDKKPPQDIGDLISYLRGEKYRSKTILLCSDHPDTEELFKTRLDNVITFTKKSQRDNVLPPHRISYSDDSVDKTQLLDDSLIDMFLLSACDELLYQGNSSFSNISRALSVNENQVAYDWLKVVAANKI